LWAAAGGGWSTGSHAVPDVRVEQRQADKNLLSPSSTPYPAIITIIIWGDPAPSAKPVRPPVPDCVVYAGPFGWFDSKTLSSSCFLQYTHAGTHTLTHSLTLTPLHSHDPLGTARCATPVGKWDDAGIFRRLQDLALRPPHTMIVMRLSIRAVLALCP
jgi:hypothetical protein